MRNRIRKYLIYLLFLTGGGTLFQGNNAGFGRCAGDTLLTTINFCFIFDCQNGAIGGGLEFCGDQPGDDIFIDCPAAGGG